MIKPKMRYEAERVGRLVQTRQENSGVTTGPNFTKFVPDV